LKVELLGDVLSENECLIVDFKEIREELLAIDDSLVFILG